MNSLFLDHLRLTAPHARFHPLRDLGGSDNQQGLRVAPQREGPVRRHVAWDVDPYARLFLQATNTATWTDMALWIVFALAFAFLAVVAVLVVLVGALEACGSRAR